MVGGGQKYRDRKRCQFPDFELQKMILGKYFSKIGLPLKTPPKKRATHNLFPLEVWLDFTKMTGNEGF